VSQPGISVVIPAYNAAPFIADAVDSALRQTRPPAEVVVVDDGSTDGTLEALRGFGERVIRVRQANRRQAAARNEGVRRTHGELLAFLDADDIWEPQKLEAQVSLLRAPRAAGVVYCSVTEFTADGAERVVRVSREGVSTRGVLLGLTGTGGGSTPLVRRSAFSAVGGFDEELSPCEDTDLAWRLALACEVDVVEEPLVRYRLHATNAHRDVNATTRAWKRLYAKALRDPTVRRFGAVFRARCRTRLYYMLAGDHVRTGRATMGMVYALLAVLAWPPVVMRPLRRSVERR
jgi:glycosyltransferase involved in cell wall biosynthesis